MQNATRAEAAAAAAAAGGSFDFEFDAPKGHSREVTGINALLFKKGKEHILAFRDTESPGESFNVESWITSSVIDGDAEDGMTKRMKMLWEKANLTWGKNQTVGLTTRSKVSKASRDSRSPAGSRGHCGYVL